MGIIDKFSHNVATYIVAGLMGMIILAFSLSSFIVALDSYWQRDSQMTVTGLFMGCLFAYLAHGLTRWTLRNLK